MDGCGQKMGSCSLLKHGNAWVLEVLQRFEGVVLKPQAIDDSLRSNQASHIMIEHGPLNTNMQL